MLSLTGWTVGEYFHIGCEVCVRDVKLMNLRWVGDVPQVEAMELLINRLKKTNNNLEFLMTLQGN